MVPTFSSFAAIDHKEHFRKNLTGFLNLAAFLGTTPTFLKKNELPDAESNAESIGTNVKSQKRIKQKVCMPFWF